MLHIFTDGSSSRKSQTIGFGFLGCKNEKEILFQENFGFKHSQLTGASELLGILFSLDYCLSNNLEKEEIILYCDSQYAIYEITKWFKDHLLKRFQGTKNEDFIINILYKITLFKNIKFKWIKGHTDKKPKKEGKVYKISDFEFWGNNIVDELAVKAHKEVSEEDLVEFSEILEDIKSQNKKDKLFDKIFEQYIMKNKINRLIEI